MIRNLNCIKMMILLFERWLIWMDGWKLETFRHYTLVQQAKSSSILSYLEI